MSELSKAISDARLREFLDRIGSVLGRDARRASFATYAMGLLGDAERKSTEPLATRDCTDPKLADAAHQRLLHFLVDSKWSDHAVRRVAAHYALEAITAREQVEAWIVDDTGFLKQGKHSVGVQRQYTGTAGKIANCQIGVSLSLATRTEHLPIDFELYIPEQWTNDPARRREARIPDEVVFKTKLDLALDMVRRAVADDIPRGVLLADSAYGNSSDFRAQIRQLGLQYIVGVESKTKVWLVDPALRRRGGPIALRDLVPWMRENGFFRRCTWRKGTKEDLSAKFAMIRVVPAHDDGRPPDDRERVWLLIEWRDGEPEPANYFFSSLNSHKTKKRLVALAMQRWRTERVYEDLKGELGLDHYEGRRFPGWHHHVSVALSCYAFVVAERVRRFPPSARRPLSSEPQPIAA